MILAMLARRVASASRRKACMVIANSEEINGLMKTEEKTNVWVKAGETGRKVRIRYMVNDRKLSMKMDKSVQGKK